MSLGRLKDGTFADFEETADLVELFDGAAIVRRRVGGHHLAANAHMLALLKPGKRHPDTYALPLKPPGRRA